MLHKEIQNSGPAPAMIFVDFVVRRQLVYEHHETISGLLMKLDSHLRRTISKYRGIPGEYEFIRASYLQVLARVHKDAALFDLRVNPKSSPNDGVQLDIGNNTVAWTHPAPQAVWIKPHVEDFFA
jgi:hypothetical protein